MTTKSTTFKRVALALVAALSFGVLGGANSNALLADSESLTLSASSASVAPGETATVTATVTFTTSAASESMTLEIDNADSSAFTKTAWGLTSDSSNVASAASVGWRVNTTVTPTTEFGIVSNASTVKTVTAKTTFAFIVPTNATAPAVYNYTIALRQGSDDTLEKVASFTLTVTAKDTTATAAKSKFWINQAAAAQATQPIEADSALVVSAGASPTGVAVTPATRGYVYWIPNNASDTNIVTGSNVTGDMLLVLSGPGGLADDAACSATTIRKSVTVSRGEYAAICSDGEAGVATITAYIGSTKFTQAAKTVTFYGKAVTLTAEANPITAAGGNLSSASADSRVVGTSSVTGGQAIVTFVAKDSAGYKVTDAAQNRNGNLYCISSDTAVVGASNTGAPGDKNLYIAASYDDEEEVWNCDMTVRKAGTATITIADSFTVASSAYTSSAITITTETKTGYTGTISFDKATYTVGEQAIITVTSKAKTTGNNVGQAALSGSASNPFVDIVQNRPFSGAKSGYGFGGGSGLSWDLGSSTFVNGVETYVVYMPNTSGAVTLTGFTSYDSSTSNTAVSVSVAVTDPAETAANAATAAAKAAETASVAAAKAAEAAAVAAAEKAAKDAVAAAEKAAKDAVAAADAAKAAAVAEAAAATDAALEAIDAANAATDAANIAAEAADAATVAAEEARDAADAATAAVEALATEVATLMAALKAQITTLANTVAKIAKKVRA